MPLHKAVGTPPSSPDASSLAAIPWKLVAKRRGICIYTILFLLTSVIIICVLLLSFENSTFSQRKLQSRFRTKDLSSHQSWDQKFIPVSALRHPRCTQSVLRIVITSAPWNRDKRVAIRSTWCSKDFPVQCIFLIGLTKDTNINTRIFEEFVQFRDILVSNFTDTYRNLTLKVMTGFYWINATCPTSFLLKTDDDCFVNSAVLHKLVSYNMKLGAALSKLYIGNVFEDDKQLDVIRHSSNKWHVSREQYPVAQYPPYASGTGYLLTGLALAAVLAQSRYYQMFPNEDAYVGVLAEAANIRPVSSSRFTLLQSGWRTCNFLYLVVIHRVSPSQQHELHGRVQQALSQCQQAFITTWD